jgi:release factor glutamine methyltransferase
MGKMAGVYTPAEDSMLLLRHAEARVHGYILDMGTGSGLLAVAAAQKPEVERVVAVDIDPDAIVLARRRAEGSGVSDRIEFRIGDLFDGVDGEGFDFILFNPPYLPSEEPIDEASWSGGEGGGEVIRRFLDAADGHLKPGGAIIMVLSSQTGLGFEEVGEKYSVTVLEELPLFFERLYCLLLRPVSPSGGPGRTRR